MLTPFAQDIWISDGPTVSTLGFKYPTRMAVIKLPSDNLFVWSPVPIDAEMREQIDALGPVKFIVSPNSLHHLSMGAWAQAYPDAALCAAPNLMSKRDDLSFAFEITDMLPSEWADAFEHSIIRGNTIATEVVFFHRASGTVLFADLLQQFPKGWHKGWRAWVAKLDLMVQPEPTVPRKFRAAFRDKKAARLSLAPVLNWPAQAVLMAHGTPVTRDAQSFLQRAFKWLKV